MYVVSRYSGRGRGIWTSVDHGSVDIRDRNKRVKVRVVTGIAIEETTWTKGKRTILRYGRDFIVKQGKRIVYQEFYDPKTLRGMVKGGLWKREKDLPLCGTKGTLECFSTSSGACGREIFTYDNGTIGYVAARWRKKLVVYRPNSKLWMIVKGKTHVSRCPIYEQLEKKETDFDIWRFMDGQNWDLTIYGDDGKTVVTCGHYKNRQKEDTWLENGKTHYYIAGIRISRSIYEDDPLQWNPYELLRIANAQLRCSLLSKFGYDNLLARVQSKVLDSSYDGGQLVEIVTNERHLAEGVDKTLHFIKVVCPSTHQTYVLRVPPDINKLEEARQWTFGLRQESISDGAHFDLVKET